MFDSGRSWLQQASTASGDSTHFPKPFVGATDPKLSFKSFAQRDGYRAGHGVAGQAREFTGKLAGFIVLDVKAHGNHQVDGQACVYLMSWLVSCPPVNQLTWVEHNLFGFRSQNLKGDMRWTKWLQETLPMRFGEDYGSWTDSRLTQGEVDRAG